jgi:hypothetical protein
LPAGGIAASLGMIPKANISPPGAVRKGAAASVFLRIPASRRLRPPARRHAEVAAGKEPLPLREGVPYTDPLQKGGRLLA